MRETFFLGLFISLMLTLPLVVAASEAVATDPRASVVAIHTFNIDASAWRRSGAGFLLTAQGHILTAKHVIANPPHLSVKVEFADRPAAAQYKDADVVRVDPYFDLAVVRVIGDDLPPPVTFGHATDMREGDEVTVIGHPTRGGAQSPFQTARMRIKTKERGLWILDDEMFPGNSGGPVLNLRNEVVGVAISRSEGHDESYVLPMNFSLDLLAEVGINATPGEVADYQTELFRLEQELTTLTGLTGQYSKAIDYLRADLEWDISIRSIDNPSTEEGITDRALEITYNKKFPDQYNPVGEIFMDISPIWDPSAIDRQPGNPHPAITIPMSGDFRTTPEGIPVATIPQFDRYLRNEIRSLNAKNRTEYTLHEVKGLLIKLQPTFKEKPDFPYWLPVRLDYSVPSR